MADTVFVIAIVVFVAFELSLLYPSVRFSPFCHPLFFLVEEKKAGNIIKLFK